MKKLAENICEAEIEDALVTYLDILKEILAIEKEVRLLARQYRLIEGKRRADILLAVGDEIFLIELKAKSFNIDHIKQILAYKEELAKLQYERKLIGDKIVPVLLVTNFSKKDYEFCEKSGVKIYKYAPVDILTKYYEKVANIATFMKIKPIDLGVFNIGLINRVMKGLEDGLSTLKDLSEFSSLSPSSVTHHLEFAKAFRLIAQRQNRYYLTDLGLKYISLSNDSLTQKDELSEGQTTLLREHIAKDPFSSPMVFGIYTIVESMFLLSRNNYPVDLEELKTFFLKVAGKKYEWQAPKTLSTATYTYLNYAIRLGLLGKIGKQIVITPTGFSFILMLQLHKSIEMVETLTMKTQK